MSYGATESGNSVKQVRDNSSISATAEDAEAAHSVSLGWKSKVSNGVKEFYDRNFGLFLVFLAQTCGTVMNTSAKLLATGNEVNIHAMQIIFIRMLCTTILGTLYMWYHAIPHFPLGQNGIRWLLILRGTAGFVGLCGLYYSLSWLEISDATVITFIIPTVTAFVCFIWLREPFTMNEAMAGLLAFIGVLLVARPPWLFSRLFVAHDLHPQIKEGSFIVDMYLISTSSADDTPSGGKISARQRTIAIIAAVLGSFGASTAYATIRVIGKRSHSLISVNYFAAIATIGSMIIIFIHPDLHFVAPQSLGQWGLIAIIGLSGFLLQFLLTEGLQREKAGRATNLMYLQLVFTLIIERVIWGTTPPILSFVGGALIIGAAIWVSLQKNKTSSVEVKAKVVDEEASLLGEGQGGSSRTT